MYLICFCLNMSLDVIKQQIVDIPLFQAIKSIKTARGSVYTFLPDGTTQRYQTAEDREHLPQDAIVFIPDFETVKRVAPTDFDVGGILGENELQYEQILLRYSQLSGHRIYIMAVDTEENRRLNTNKEIADAVKDGMRIFLFFFTGSKLDFILPVSAFPKLGYYTFDTRRFKDPETGSMMRERHIGNKIVEIKYRES